MWRNRKGLSAVPGLGQAGQSMAEYALVVVIIIAAVAGMQTYYKRGMQAKIKGTIDGMNLDTGSTFLQYEPYYATSDFTTSRNITTQHEEYEQQGTLTRDETRGVTRTGTQQESGGNQLSADNDWLVPGLP